MKSHSTNRLTRFPQSLQRRSYRRRGVVAVYVALTMVGLLGAAALSFDLSYLYNRKAEAQKAADAAALAGAVKGDAVAKQYAAANGYGDAQHATVSISTDGGLYRVTLSRPEPLYFARLFTGGTSNVGATAAAEYQAPVDIPMQNYGIENGPVNLSVFGPDAMYNNGDPFSPTRLQNGDTNTQHRPGGYDFALKLATDPSNTNGLAKYKKDHGNQLDVEIFDPGSTNAGGGISPSLGKAIDESRAGWSADWTTDTKYSLYYDNGTPSNPDDDILVDSKTFGADTADTDMKWTDALHADLSDETKFPTKTENGPANFRVNVTPTAGSSENGFELRAGPPHSDMSSEEWQSTYGAATSITATGDIPMNFNTNSTITINLGNVPAMPLGGQVTITKFDLDVDSKSLVYHDTNDATHTTVEGGTWPNGVLADSTGHKDGIWTTDTYKLPPGYTGGAWTAEYTAGWQDTSVWEITYSGQGKLRLVR